MTVFRFTWQAKLAGKTLSVVGALGSLLQHIFFNFLVEFNCINNYHYYIEKSRTGVILENSRNTPIKIIGSINLTYFCFDIKKFYKKVIIKIYYVTLLSSIITLISIMRFFLLIAYDNYQNMTDVTYKTINNSSKTTKKFYFYKVISITYQTIKESD